jgi:hypothetical protein
MAAMVSVEAVGSVMDSYQCRTATRLVSRTFEPQPQANFSSRPTSRRQMNNGIAPNSPNEQSITRQ